MKLPTGEIIDGKKIYEQLIHYYTTTNLPVGEIYQKGQKVLDIFYPKVTLKWQEIPNLHDL